jgi:hypothetical protein
MGNAGVYVDVDGLSRGVWLLGSSCPLWGPSDSKKYKGTRYIYHTRYKAAAQGTALQGTRHNHEVRQGVLSFEALCLYLYL